MSQGFTNSLECFRNSRGGNRRQAFFVRFNVVNRLSFLQQITPRFGTQLPQGRLVPFERDLLFCPAQETIFFHCIQFLFRTHFMRNGVS